MTSPIESLANLFQTQFGYTPTLYSRAPGRVNLIGEHTDYNQGFVFPAALEFKVEILAAARPDNQVCLYSQNFAQPDRFTLERIEKSTTAPWSNYVRGVIGEFITAGHYPGGFDAVISGNVPLGSGLSSSAALEVCTAVMLCALFGIEIPGPELALLCQRAENRFVGVNCGIMDQFISILGREEHALLIDCRDLTHRAIPLPMAGHSLIICDSHAPRELAGSAYNRRREECEAAVALLAQSLPGIKSLRDVSLEQFGDLEAHLPEPIRRRCRHVISENARTLEGVKVLEDRRLAAFGKLMELSHKSLRDDYEVSSEYLDILVEAALEGPECLGSRLTGAGFGGCTVSLVRNEGREAFTSRVRERYRKKTGKEAGIYTSAVCRGAEARPYREVGGDLVTG